MYEQDLPKDHFIVTLSPKLSKAECEQAAEILNDAMKSVGICLVQTRGIAPHILHFYQFAIAF